MKSISSFKRGLAKIHRLWIARDYQKALSETGRMLSEWPDNPCLLVIWADLIQLQEKDAGPSLEDAKNAYQRAVEMDPDSPAAFIELGKYLYAVEDDASAADKLLEKAVRSCKQLLKDALLARAEALTEMDRKQEAMACMAEAILLQSHNGKSGEKISKDIREKLGNLSQSGYPRLRV